MNEQAMKNTELIEENALLKQRIQELEQSESKSKQAEEALLESENKFKNFAEQALAGIYLIQDGVFKYVNPKFAQMFGYTVEECLNDMPIKNLVHADDMTKVEVQIRRRTSGEVEFVHYTFRGIKKMGQIFHVEIYGSTGIHKGRPAAVGTILDITERKRAEAALKESEGKYNQFFRTSRDCVFITSKDGSWIDLNDAAVELFGYSSREELMQVKISNLYVNPEERIKHNSIIAERGYSKEFPVDLRRKDGTVRHTLITSVARYDAEGNVIGFQGTIRDITERKRAEEALRASEERYRSLASSIDSMYLVDKDCRYMFVNEQCRRRYGIPLKDIIGKRYNDFHSEGNSEKFAKIVKDVFETGKAIQMEHLSERDKSFFLRTFSPAMDQEGKSIAAVTIVSKDITERKRAEEALEEERRQLRQALDEVRTLRGIVPICANCKKIRDDEGYWNQVEKYVSDHTEAKFSHGICPDCIKIVYPEYKKQ